MDSRTFKRDNHYVPRSYLKRWASDDGRLWSFRVLVSHPAVPHWRKVSPRGVAFHSHLYTRTVAGGESDDLERWLDVEFEGPAEESIERAVSGRRLTPTDWRRLARFFAAQDARTPARLVEDLKRWSRTMQPMLDDVMRGSVARLGAMSPQERAAQLGRVAANDAVPFRVTIQKNPDGQGGLIKGETILGRNLWVWSIKSLLTGPSLRALEGHRWTILTPPDGVTWFTTDDPVLKLNFNSPIEYDFGGGWGSTGTDLFLPLGPHHLLFTQVGKRVPPRGTPMDRRRADLIRRLTAEHAHRYVFAAAPDPFVARVRPPVVDGAALKRESAQWEAWHAAQSEAERELMGWHPAESPELADGT